MLLLMTHSSNKSTIRSEDDETNSRMGISGDKKIFHFEDSNQNDTFKISVLPNQYNMPSSSPPPTSSFVQDFGFREALNKPRKVYLFLTICVEHIVFVEAANRVWYIFFLKKRHFVYF